MLEVTFKDWCIKCHADTNHNYDDYLPYEFHLRMVSHISKYDIFKDIRNYIFNQFDVHPIDLDHSCWAHDLIEDARIKYTNLKKEVERRKTNSIIRGESIINPHTICEIVYAVTDPKGRTKDERCTPEHLKGIKDQPGATFVKLCDRIANVQYGLMTGSSMFKKYKKMNPFFKEHLYSEEYKVMFDYLDDLFIKVN